MRILGVIPARGGSKRLPQKNILNLKGKPLINWTIEVAKESGIFINCLVSTDDENIASVAREAGAMAPWLRPTELATDNAGSADVIAHAVKWYETEFGLIDAVVMLQPTSPFRKPESIRGAVKVYMSQIESKVFYPVVSVSPARTHPAWTFTIQNGELVPTLGWQPFILRSQDLPVTYSPNGSIYVIPSEAARNAENIIRHGIKPYFMNNIWESIDIDTSDDWDMALKWAEILGVSP